MWYKLPLYDANGKKLKDINLNEVIFNDQNINNDLIHEFVVMQLANVRNAIAHTKTRAEVNLSGRKLFRQKWTGRARVGDAGSPIRRHWGVAFWPRNNRNFSKAMPQKMRIKALFGTLTLKARDWEMLGLDKYPFEEIKTKNAYDVISKLGLADSKVLVVIPQSDEVLMKSLRNIPNVKYILANYLNPYDLLTHKKVLFVQDALEKVEEVFAK